MKYWNEQLDQLTHQQRDAMVFLRSHLPVSDLDCYPFSLFLQFVDHAIALRQQAPWCAKLEEEIFLHYVLFPRVNDEDLSFHRALFQSTLWNRIVNLSSDEARVLEVNRWCHEEASYQSQDERTASPLTVWRSGSGRCGEESAFLVSALRSVGIAARQVYSPRWTHCDDNHAWVEALCDGQWRFLGACEPEPILDRGWFNTAASRALLIHSRLFGAGTSPLHGCPLGRNGAVTWYNQTSRYAQTHVCRIQVQWDGLPAAGAIVHIQVLNEADFHTVAVLTADSTGLVQMELGLGDFHVFAQWEGRMAEGNYNGSPLTLALKHSVPVCTTWKDFDIVSARSAPMHPALLTAAQKAERSATLSSGTACRKKKLEHLEHSSHAPGPWKDLIRSACGNGTVLLDFLSMDEDPRREALLRTLSQKDLRDISSETLADHLANTPPDNGLPAELYTAYVLCPRIELEPLTPWRQAFRQVFTPAAQAMYRKDPNVLWDALCRRMGACPPRIYPGRSSGLVWTPLGAWRAGHCDRRSLYLLFVAVLRALGIPARLRALDGTPEFWQDGRFRPLDTQVEGTLELHCEKGSSPLYHQNWSLSHWDGQGWQPVGGCGEEWKDEQYALCLPVGYYRIITSVRMPNGNQFAASRVLLIEAGKTIAAELQFRQYVLQDLLGCQDMPMMAAHALDGALIPDFCRTGSPLTMLFWIEEGSEPTEHTLNELTACRHLLQALPVQLVFLVRSKESIHQPTLAALLRDWPEIRVLLDDWGFDLETVSRHLSCDPDRPPLAVLCNDKGQALYGTSGYHVGSVQLLTRIASQLSADLSAARVRTSLQSAYQSVKAASSKFPTPID